MMFKEMKFGRVDILWLESNLLCLTRKIRIRLDQSVVYPCCVGRRRRSTEPTGALKGGMKPPHESKALIDGPKISDFVLAISKTRNEDA
jgi:hypothetical protein